jgi:hypothetical protein
MNYVHIGDGLFENPFEEYIEHKHEQVFALLIGECFFKGEIKREGSKAGLRHKLGWRNNSSFFGHNNASFYVKVKRAQECDIIKGGCEAPYNKEMNIEKSSEPDFDQNSGSDNFHQRYSNEYHKKIKDCLYFTTGAYLNYTESKIFKKGVSL